MRAYYCLGAGLLAGLALGINIGKYIESASDTVRRGGIQGAAIAPVSAVMDSWDGVRLVKMCPKGVNIYNLPDGSYRTAPHRNAPFGAIVVDPEKVC